MTNKTEARKFFLHSPADAAQSYVQWAEKLQAEPGITYGCVLDKFLIPLHPGDLMAVVARPGHGKSSWMAYMAKKTARDIVARGAEDEVVVYVSWEQPIEEIEAFFESGDSYSSTDMAWGKVPLDVIRRKAVKRGGLPIWYVGKSLRHAHVKKPPMYIDAVYAAIEAMRYEYGLRPVLICLDYIQKIPVAKGYKRFEQVTEAVFATKDLLMDIGAPGIAGVQARREVDTYRDQIPSMSDAQHSSAIEQEADKQIGIWRPIKTHDPARTPFIEVAGKEYANTESLFVIRLLKQRFEQGYGTFAINFKPQTLEVYDYEYKSSYAANGHAPVTPAGSKP